MNASTQTMPLLATKFYIPSPHANVVARPHLLARLDEGLRLGRRLTLIAAPAGYGKTTLVSEWVNQGIGESTEQRSVAWLTLDEGDSDPARFWSYLLSSLRTAMAIELDIPDALQLPKGHQMINLMTELINLIGSETENLLLVLDDYHLVTAQPVHDALAFLLDHQPPNLHLVIAARADPPLPLARLRARGQLMELRQADLCFTPEEAAAFLNQRMGLNLAAADVAALDRRTEGWIAGLHMAALALQGISAERDASAFIAAFTGAHRYILDYLLEEVLNRESQPVQAFLLQTAILDRLCAPLCDAVVESGTDSQTILEYLERANLFVVPLDGRREWYRYHRLFSDLLQQRLHKTWPDLVHSLHSRASLWYVANGDVSSAIDHALAAEDFDRAADLIEKIAESTLMHGETTTLLRWSDALPTEAICARPILCMLDAWTLLLSGRPLDVVEARLAAAEPYSERIPGQIPALRSLLAAYQVRLNDALQLARQALVELPEENVLMRSFVLWILSAYGALYRDASDVVIPLDQLARIGLDSGNVLVAVSALTQLAEAERRCGRLHKAWSLYQRALDLAVDAQGQRLPLAGQPLMGLGDLAAEWHDFEAAERYLQDSIALTEQWNEVGALEAYLALAWLKWVQQDAGVAQAMIDTARQLAIRFDVTEVDDWAVALSQARFALAQGDLATVQRWLEAQDVLSYADKSLPEVYDTQPLYRLRKYELIVLSRLLILQGKAEYALGILDRLLPVAKRQQRPSLMIEIHLLKALAYNQCGRRDQALASLAQGLTLAEPEGYTRPFVDMGAPLRLLIEDFRVWIGRQQRSEMTAPVCAYAEKLLSVLENSSPIPHEISFSAIENPKSKIQNQTSKIQNLLEPLSEREMDVLRLLDSSLSTTEMADALFVSVHTVRSHLKNIYSKLDVHSRYEAVAKAKDIGIL
jgi:LuxR family maltose regulon positive regulatory protein